MKYLKYNKVTSKNPNYKDKTNFIKFVIDHLLNGGKKKERGGSLDNKLLVTYNPDGLIEPAASEVSSK